MATLVDTRPKVLSDEELWSVMTRYAGHPDVMSVFATMNAIRQSREEANVTETEEVERVCWTVINGQPCVLDADHAGGHQSADTALSIAQKRIDELSACYATTSTLGWCSSPGIRFRSEGTIPTCSLASTVC